jgi:integrase
MNFSWDDDRRIHPIWPSRKEHFPTLAIPSSQKNKKTQEVPMLPGLRELLEQTPKTERQGWVVNPEPIDCVITTTPDWCKPVAEDLARLAQNHNNSAIARACGVTEASIRKWLREAGIRRNTAKRKSGEVDKRMMNGVRRRAESSQSYVAKRSVERLTKEHVSRIISRIGKQAGIIVQQPDEETGKRIKYASAHDLRRGCAQRLINAGVSAETLKLVMRHQDFSTTERFYGATRAAQSAAVEINEKLAAASTTSAAVGGTEESPQLSAEELHKLKALLNAL